MKCVIDQKRETDRPLVCGPCRRGLSDDLRALVDAYAMLVVGEVLDGANDPVSQTLPAGTVRSGSRGAPVTGSREAPVPLDLDVVDLTAEARPGSLAPHARGVLGMDDTQVGYLAVATELDTWVRNWIDVRQRDEHLPVPTVTTLVGWLLNRLDWACDEHEAIDEFRGDIRRLLRQCQRHGNDLPQRPEYLDGVPCSGCDLMALYREPGSRYRAECGSCGRLYTDDEYERYVALLAAQIRRVA